MKKIKIYVLIAFLVISTAYAATMVRDMPTEVAPSSSFIVTYMVTEAPTGNWGVLLEDDISGGCTPTELNTGWLSPQTTYHVTFTAPSSGSCTFTGNYQFADSSGSLPETNFADQIVTITPKYLQVTFDKTTVNVGETLTITYHQPQSVSYGIIQEIPSGWTTSATLSPDGKYRTYVDSGADSTLLLVAPSSPVTSIFNGQYFVYPETTYTNMNSVTINVVTSVACNSNSECGSDGYIGNEYCSNNDIYRNYRNYICNNPGTQNSYCSYLDTSVLTEDCGDSGSGSTYCVDNDVYQHYYTRGCSAGTCTEVDNPTLIQACAPEKICSNGACVSAFQNKLEIEKVKITYDGKSKTAKDGDTIKNIKPGMDLKAKIYVKNLFTEDIDIEDVEITATIEGIDDGDDLEEEGNGFDIGAGKSKSETLNFEIPLLVDDGTYDFTIDVEGQDENGTEHTATANIELEVEKEKHNLIINKATLTPETVSCGQDTNLDLEVINIGSEDEDEVVITLKNTELNFDKKEELGIDSGDDEETIFTGSYLIDVAEDLAAGTYPIEIKVYYNTDSLEDTKEVDLIVEECEVEEDVWGEEEIEEEAEEEEEEETVIQPQQPTEKEETFWDKYGLALIIVGYILVIIVFIALIVHALKK